MLEGEYEPFEQHWVASYEKCMGWLGPDGELLVEERLGPWEFTPEEARGIVGGP